MRYESIVNARIFLKATIFIVGLFGIVVISLAKGSVSMSLSELGLAIRRCDALFIQMTALTSGLL